MPDKVIFVTNYYVVTYGKQILMGKAARTSTPIESPQKRHQNGGAKSRDDTNIATPKARTMSIGAEYPAIGVVADSLRSIRLTQH